MAVTISSNIATKNIADKYATHLDNLGKGGVHTKESISGRNSITTERRTRFMLCVVANIGDGSPGLYWLNTPPSPTSAQLADNQYWQPVPLGTSVDGVLNLQGFESAGSLTIQDGVGSTGDTFIVDVGGSVNDPAIFGGQAVTLVAGDYLVYEGTKWNVIATGATSVNWNTLPGKPDTFTPSPHTHVVADITDFPNLANYLTTSNVISEILVGSNDIRLANVGAIKQYVTEQINGIDIPETDLSNYYTQAQVDSLIAAVEGYILYTADSLTELNNEVQNPEEGAFAYIQGEYSMYRRISAQWEFQYTTTLPETTEAEGLYKIVNDTAHGFVEGDVIVLNQGVYEKAVNTDLTPLGVVVDVIGANDFKLWLGGWTGQLSGLTPDVIYYISTTGEITTNNTGRPILETTSDTTAFLFGTGGASLGNFRDYIIGDLSTGIVEGLEISINAGDNTLFDIATGKALVIDSTVTPVGITLIEIDTPITGVAVTALATENNTDIALDENGAIIQRPGAGFVTEEYRTLVPLGGLDHNSRTIINGVFNFGSLSFNTGNNLNDLALALGPINVTGNVFGFNGNNLNIDYEGGEIFSFSENRANDVNKPNTLTEADQTALSFLEYYNDGSNGSIVNFNSTIDPNTFDDGSGTLAAVPQNDWQIMRLGLFPNSGTKTVRKGTQTFKNKEEALDFLTTERPPILQGFERSFLRSYLVVQEGATDLSNIDQAEFRQAGRFGDLDAAEGVGANIDDTSFQIVRGISSQAAFQNVDDILVQRGATGVYYGGNVTLNGTNSVDITAGRGQITNRSNPENISFSFIDWTAKTAFAINVANPITFLYFDLNDDTVKTTTSFPTSQNRARRIYIGALATDGTQIVGLIDQRDWIGNDVQQLRLVAEFLGEGKFSGGEVTANGANLSLNISTLVKFDFGGNDDPEVPHKVNVTFGTPVSFQHFDVAGNLYGTRTALDVGNYYPSGGPLTNVPNNDYQLMQVYAFSDGNVGIQYDSFIYQTLAAAEASIVTQPRTKPLITQGGVRLAYLIVKQGITNLTTALSGGTAKLIPTNKFGEFGGGAGGGTSGALVAANDLADVEDPVVSQSNLQVVDSAYTNLGATPSFDLNTGTIFKRTMDQNVTDISFTNGFEGITYIVKIKVTANTSFTFEYINDKIGSQDGVELILPPNSNDFDIVHYLQVELNDGGDYIVTPRYNQQLIRRSKEDTLNNQSVTITEYTLTDSVT